MKKKKSISFIVVLLTVLFITTLSAQAELFNRGTDSLGNRLIYDSDLNITWYDYTKSPDLLQSQINWASGLTVNFGGTIFDDWRLPTSVFGPWGFSYDGTTTGGYNITSSEMGHLFYVGLGNAGEYDIYGNLTGCTSGSTFCLTNTGGFQHLTTGTYFSGTRYSEPHISGAWVFVFGSGYQYPVSGYPQYQGSLKALAVRSGDVVPTDSDSDGILNQSDNCPDIANPLQEDNDQDLTGDVCDPDDDNDGVLDPSDNCQFIANPSQDDNDKDNIGDVCDTDDDNDNIADSTDNCLFIANLNQSDIDGDGLGDVCDSDPDGDGITADDNCPMAPNSLQENNDGDSEGDACDTDDDNDGVLDSNDNCPTVANQLQEDLDQDNIGDACDIDIDGDGVENYIDNCPAIPNIGQEDTDGDGDGDTCDIDDDNDGVLDGTDNCQLIVNPDQGDYDEDGKGDMCDDDLDGDGVSNDTDNCRYIANSNQYDWNNDGEGDACDADVDNDGVLNTSDLCEFTQVGTVVDPSNGCSIGQLNPCDGPRGTTVAWKNHGQYVSSVAKTANSFLAQGLITQEEKDAIVSASASSTCGQK